MSDNEFSLEVRKKHKAPFMIVYGPAGTGKTTFGFNSPKPVFLQTEDGAGELELTTLKDGVFTEYEDIIKALRYIYTNADELDVETVVIDSLDHLEPIVWDYVCRKNDWESIESPGYGKGYIECDKAWLKLINALISIRDAHGIGVVCIAHEIVRVVNDPMTEPYDAHELKLHKRAVALWKEKSDVVGLLKNPVVTDVKTGKGKGGTSPNLYLRPNAAYTAKCRYKDMPNFIPIKPDSGWDNFAKHVPFYNQ